MTSRKTGSPAPQHVLDEAIGWMMALRENALTPAERAEFETWLKQDMTHRVTWDRLNGALAPFHSVSTSLSGASLAASFERHSVSRRTALKKGVGAVVASGLCLALTDRWLPLGDVFARYRTSTGQRGRFELADGSTLILDARSAADPEAFGDQDRDGLRLHDGMALVQARQDDTPFTVAAGPLRVAWRAGRAMFVSRGSHLQTIAVDGDLVLSLGVHPPYTIPAGRGVRLVGDRFVELATNEILNSVSWVDGKLILHDRPLQALVDAVRPYQAGIVSITEAAAMVRVSGVFDLDKIDETLEMITSLFPVRVVRLGSLVRRIEAR